MPLDSVASLVDTLRHSRLLQPAQVEELTHGLAARFPAPRDLARELLQRGWLTPYQVNQLFQGRGQDLVLGSYVLLERLGQGGMGQVFKASNWKLDRTVALKLIRKERLANPDAVRRFQREIRAAAQLAHPNIVHAHDADEVRGTHIFVMEYVEGIDLGKLVRKRGPLPVAQACDYIRQAALGLQHAHECGLVHRDIKPGNLLLSRGAVVKILDMGLALLHQGDSDDSSTSMTATGCVIGTADYIAPEQARDSHTADIRADLYSLGCSLYHLLTGRVPFPRGTVTEKLLQHNMDEPQPVEQLRPEVPLPVAAVVRKLMAKRPEDRYQTPGEAAVALAAVVQTLQEPSPSPARSQPDQAETETLDAVLAFMATSDTTEAADSPAALRRQAERRWWFRFNVAGGILLLSLAALFAALLWWQHRPAVPPADQSDDVTQPRDVTPPPTADKPRPVDAAWIKHVATLGAGEQVKTVVKKLRELNPGFDGQVHYQIKNGAVWELSLCTDHVENIDPVRALPRLRRLECKGTFPGYVTRKGKLASLEGLKGLGLRRLVCGDNPKITDLTPLKGMPLDDLICGGTGVTDLSVLKDLSVAFLDISATGITDLSSLKGTSVKSLVCAWMAMRDLSPLKDVPLIYLDVRGTFVHDLSPLQGLPLVHVRCDLLPDRDTQVLRSIRTLQKINDEPVAEVWKRVDAEHEAFDKWLASVRKLPAAKQVEAVAARLKDRNPGFGGSVTPAIENGKVTGLQFLSDRVTDISPLRALGDLQRLDCHGTFYRKGLLVNLWPIQHLRLKQFSCNDTLVNDLTPLKDMPLSDLSCGSTSVIDLAPLKRLPLTSLNCGGLAIDDLSVLKGKQLRELTCGWTHVGDISVLRGMPLTSLNCQRLILRDLSPLRGMPLKQFVYDIRRGRDVDVLRSIKSLETINNKPAKDVLEEAPSKDEG
ncbi:MAG TPA: serine/threonine-protein kinase [Gemmataceae bacterium]|nr:serine/threonine-protein kinase [Gemmataceae bacterium]